MPNARHVPFMTHAASHSSEVHMYTAALHLPSAPKPHANCACAAPLLYFTCAAHSAGLNGVQLFTQTNKCRLHCMLYNKRRFFPPDHKCVLEFGCAKHHCDQGITLQLCRSSCLFMKSSVVHKIPSKRKDMWFVRGFRNMVVRLLMFRILAEGYDSLQQCVSLRIAFAQSADPESPWTNSRCSSK